jgi:tetratricopeptide (TPR) repeat protein
MAAVSIHQDKIDLAIEQSKHALDLNQNNTDAYYNLAYAFEEKQNFNQALENYQTAIRLDSSFTRAYSALGNLLVQNNQAAQAIRILQLAEHKTPKSDYIFLIHKNLGKAYYYLDQYKNAISHLQLSLETQMMDMPETWYYLGLCYKETGDKDKCVEALKHYMNVEPDGQKKTRAQTIIDELVISN